MYQLRKKNLAHIVAIYGRGRELFRPPIYNLPSFTMRQITLWYSESYS